MSLNELIREIGKFLRIGDCLVCGAKGGASTIHPIEPYNSAIPPIYQVFQITLCRTHYDLLNAARELEGDYDTNFFATKICQQIHEKLLPLLQNRLEISSKQNGGVA